MSKTELDIKLNEHLINAAREIKSHCSNTPNCEECIFLIKSGYSKCRLDQAPCNWEVDSDKL